MSPRRQICSSLRDTILFHWTPYTMSSIVIQLLLLCHLFALFASASTRVKDTWFCPGGEARIRSNATVELIGFISSFDPEKLFTVGAVPYSVESVNRNASMIPGRVLCYAVGAFNSSSPYDSIRLMTEMRETEGVRSFVGLHQSCAVEASVAAAWDFPLISYRCTDTKVSNKTSYPTFARTLAPSSKISKSLIATLKHFDWYKVVVIAANTSADYRAIEDAFRQGIDRVNYLHRAANKLAVSPSTVSSRSVESTVSSSSSSVNKSSHEGSAHRPDESTWQFPFNISFKFIDKKKKPKYREFKIIESHYIPSRYLDRENPLFKKIAENGRSKTRIYIVIAELASAIKLARQFYKQDEDKSSGRNVIISIDKDQDAILDGLQKHCVPPHEPTNMTSERAARMDRACESMFILTPSLPNRDDNFTATVHKYSESDPFKAPKFPPILRSKPKHGQAGLEAIYAYDAVQVLANALTRAYKQFNSSNITGSQVMKHLLASPYQSVLGYTQRIDENGDADGTFDFLTFKSGIGMQRVARFDNDNCPNIEIADENDLCFRYVSNITVDWKNGIKPIDEPECGFDNEYCDEITNWVQLIFLSACFFLTSVAIGFTIKRYRYEKKLACLLWKVDVKDLILPRTSSEYTLNNLRSTVNFQGIDLARIASYKPPNGKHQLGSDIEQFTVSSGVGFYKGNVVYVKRIYKQSIDLTREIRKELIQVREMRHENINPFIGATVDSSNICLITLHCARGSLEDILRNQDLDLDNMFIASLVADLIKGMIYLHDSEIESHGNLRSSNCLVDSRWVLQISDFGLHEFKSKQDLPEDLRIKQMRRYLYRAPELLRDVNSPPKGTQKGDVYSFAILLYEIIGRKGPWGKTEDNETIESLVHQLANPHKYGGIILRPSLHSISSCPSYLIKCMEDCWHEDPEARPDFRFINLKLKDMQRGLKPNIFDNMLAIMEIYASNLEALVKERTNELLSEKKKTEMLLLRMLPKSVADQLKMGETVDPESFDSVTIYFSDIVGFTRIASESTPMQVVDLLNDLYTCFDSIIEHYDVYKVETSGDAYMVVSGLPQRNGNRHAGEIASMALHLLSEIQHFEIRHRSGERLQLRIGIHSGPCVAGVVGLKMPRYCLFGDSVNTASRMESSGEPLKIHVSDACKVILCQLEGYILKERGLTAIKGKGLMKTHWLIGKTNGSTDIASDTSVGKLSAQQSDQLNQHESNSATIELLSPSSFHSITSTSSSLSTSMAIDQQSDALASVSFASKNNDFDTLIKLNNLGAFTVTKTVLDNHSSCLNRLPPVASVTPVSRNLSRGGSFTFDEQNYDAAGAKANNNDPPDDDSNKAQAYSPQVDKRKQSVYVETATSDLSVELSGK